MFEITTREVPEQIVLTERNHLRASELPAWIGEALGRQHDALAAAGSRSALPSFVVYHGEITEDTAGPVEACTPVAPGLVGQLDLPSRVEPAHREAYTTVTRSQLAYPEIMAAYEAVEAWMREQDESMAASPREVYFADLDAAGPDDGVADVAFPILS